MAVYGAPGPIRDRMVADKEQSRENSPDFPTRSMEVFCDLQSSAGRGFDCCRGFAVGPDSSARPDSRADRSHRQMAIRCDGAGHAGDRRCDGGRALTLR